MVAGEGAGERTGEGNMQCWDGVWGGFAGEMGRCGGEGGGDEKEWERIEAKRSDAEVGRRRGRSASATNVG